MRSPEFLRDEAGGGRDGVTVGVVVDNTDPEGLGRVKLEFPVREGTGESYWARVAVPMAGDGRGTYFLPEVGDEVLVAFEAGDVHHPYVLGALWNGQQEPPADNADGENNVRTIRSRSGHEVRLDDTDGAETVEIRTGGGHTVTLDDSGGSERITLTDSSGQNSVTLAGDGTVSVEAGATLSLSAPTVELKGDGNVTVEAGGVLTLKGGVVRIN